MHLGVEGFPWDVVNMLLDLIRGKEVERKSFWITEVIFKTVVVPCGRKGVKAAFQAE